jgi:DNA modification methylase
MMRTETLGEGVTVHMGDAREILPSLGIADAVVTSPPYEQQRDYGQRIDDWRGLVSGALSGIKDGGNTQIFVNLGLIHRDGEIVAYWEQFLGDMRAAGWRFFGGWYVWDQGPGLPGDWAGRLAPAHEFIFHFNRTSRKPSKIVPCTHGGRSRDNPAVFPVALPRDLIASYTDLGEMVLDPFMGSGTTGVAAVKIGRRFTGIEVEPKYFDIARARISDALACPDLFVESPKRAEPLELPL